MESHPQNPEFWNDPENFHPCYSDFPACFESINLIFRHFKKTHHFQVPGLQQVTTLCIFSSFCGKWVLIFVCLF